MKSRLIITALIITAFALTISAQTKKIKVDISIRADAQLKSDIQTYLTQELKALENVEFVPINKGDYGISVTVLNIMPKDNSKVRYVLSYELIYWVKCQEEYHLASLKGGLRVTDMDGLRKTLQEFVVTTLARRVLKR